MKVLKFIYLVILAGGFLYLLDLIFDFNQDDDSTQKNTNSTPLTTSNLNLELTAALADKINGVNKSISNLTQNSNTTITIEAGEHLLKDTVVVIKNNKAYKFDSSIEENFSLPVGIILNEVSTGEFVIIFLTGKVNVSQNLTLNQEYFVGNNGNLITQIADDFGIQSVGYAISINQLVLDFTKRYSL